MRSGNSPAWRAATTPPKLWATIDTLELTPLSRSGRAEEIAIVAAFLASPAASYISGTDMLVDGGVIAGIKATGGPTKLRSRHK